MKTFGQQQKSSLMQARFGWIFVVEPLKQYATTSRLCIYDNNDQFHYYNARLFRHSDIYNQVYLKNGP